MDSIDALRRSRFRERRFKYYEVGTLAAARPRPSSLYQM